MFNTKKFNEIFFILFLVYFIFPANNALSSSVTPLYMQDGAEGKYKKLAPGKWQRVSDLDNTSINLSNTANQTQSFAADNTIHDQLIKEVIDYPYSPKKISPIKAYNTPRLNHSLKNTLFSPNFENIEASEIFSCSLNQDDTNNNVSQSEGLNKISDHNQYNYLSSINDLSKNVSELTIDKDLNIAPTAMGSSDDETNNLGLWSSGFITKGKGSKNNNSKYKQEGLIIGVETIIADENIIGFAYTKARIKSKNNYRLLPSERDIEGHLFSIYGKYFFNTDYYLSSSLQSGKLHIKSYQGTVNRYYGKTRGEMLSGKVDLGYNYFYGNGIFVNPRIGVAYFNSKIKGYSEHNLLNQNINISPLYLRRLSGAGVVELSKAVEKDKYKFISTIYAGLEGMINKKNGVVVISGLDNAFNNIVVKGKTKEKLNYNMGGRFGALSKCGLLEFNIGYQANIRSNFLSHTGSLKLKVNM